MRLWVTQPRTGPFQSQGARLAPELKLLADVAIIGGGVAYEVDPRLVRACSPVRPLSVYIESNLSGDKKASRQVLNSVRGRKVAAKTILPAATVRAGLHTTPAEMVRYYRMAVTACSLAGTLGTQGHFANGLAALYLACGQDAACVAESVVRVYP